MTTIHQQAAEAIRQQQGELAEIIVVWQTLSVAEGFAK